MNNDVNYREVRRGDVYWYRMDNGWGHEMGSGRPVVIVSSDEGNSKSPTLIGAYTTTQIKYGKVYVPIVLSGVESWVKCCDLVTFDRVKRLGKYIGTLTDAQMDEVDQGLRRALDLDYCYDDEYEEEIEESDDEEEYEEEESENLEEKIADLELELKIARAAYDKLLAKVVEMKVDADIASAKPEPKKVEAPKIETPKVVAPAVVAKPEPKIDVNTATETALKKIGWDSVSAKAILANRPYENLEELKSLPGVTKTLFNLVSPRMDCVRVVKEVVPVLTEKVNINTWSVEQITEALGCPKTNAGQIVAHRNKYGNFSDVNQLYLVVGLSKSFIDKYIDCFTVGDVLKAAPVKEVVVEETTDARKANVNTMTGPQIAEILGCSKAYGGYFVTYRRRNGPYVTKDDLFKTEFISRAFIEKNWEKFEL